jgi:zinc protease
MKALIAKQSLLAVAAIIGPVVILAVAAPLATPLGAQKETPPASAKPKNFRIPPHRSFTLPNGLQVTLVHYGTLPKALISLEMRTGAIDEPRTGVGIASMTSEMLLQATAGRTAQDISREAAEMGGSIEASAGAVTSTVGGEVLSDNASRFVALLADVARHPRFDAADFERVRANAIRDLAIALQNADNVSRKQFRQNLFPGHPFGTPFSTEATLKALNVGDAKSFHGANYGAARGHLYVSGVFDDARVEKAVRDAFSDWEHGKPATTNTPVAVSRRQLLTSDRPGAVQSTLYVGLPVGDPTTADFVPLQVTDALLGGAFGSRITKNIREDKGYTYSPYSYLWTRKGATYWVEVADVTTKDTGASLKEIFGEIDRVRATPPPTDEVDGIKQLLAGGFTIRNSSRGGIVGQLSFLDENGLGEQYLSTYVQKLMAVTPADVQRAARQLDPAKMTISVVGDLKVVDPQLAPFKPAIVP